MHTIGIALLYAAVVWAYGSILSALVLLVATARSALGQRAEKRLQPQLGARLLAGRSARSIRPIPVWLRTEDRTPRLPRSTRRTRCRTWRTPPALPAPGTREPAEPPAPRRQAWLPPPRPRP